MHAGCIRNQRVTGCQKHCNRGGVEQKLIQTHDRAAERKHEHQGVEQDKQSHVGLHGDRVERETKVDLHRRGRARVYVLGIGDRGT